MAKMTRNHPCPCGICDKARWCCHPALGVGIDADTNRSFDVLCFMAACKVVDVTDAEIEKLMQRVVHLPEVDLTLQIPFPSSTFPLVERARSAFDRHDDEQFCDAIIELGHQLDTATRRLALGRSILGLRDAGKIDAKLCAAAIYDLDTSTISAVLASYVAASVIVSRQEAFRCHLQLVTQPRM